MKVLKLVVGFVLAVIVALTIEEWWLTLDGKAQFAVLSSLVTVAAFLFKRKRRKE